MLLRTVVQLDRQRLDVLEHSLLLTRAIRSDFFAATHEGVVQLGASCGAGVLGVRDFLFEAVDVRLVCLQDLRVAGAVRGQLIGETTEALLILRFSVEGMGRCVEDEMNCLSWTETAIQ